MHVKPSENIGRHAGSTCYLREPVNVRDLQTVFDAISDGIAAVDGEGRVVYCNRAFAALANQPTSSLIGLGHEALARDVLGMSGLTPFPKLRESGTRQIYDLRLGSRSFRLAVDPILDGEAISGAVWTVADVTEHDEIEQERNRLESELQAKLDELAESAKRKDEFIAMLGHELRNPLSALGISLHLVDRHGASSDPRVKKALDTCHRQVQHLTRMVDDLLDVSRINRGKVELRKERLDLRSIVRSSVAVMRARAEEMGIEIAMQVPDDEICLVGDPTRLEQIINNLLSNATKYTPSGGRVTVSLTMEANGHAWAVLRVKDTGRGIPPQMLERIFDMFVQVSPSQDRTHRGLGVGLTLVRSLVEMHGGKVEAVSEGEGKGSEFIVRLPALAQPHADEQEGLRILLVEDNEDVRDTLRDLLEQWGHRVRVASDGSEAIAIALDAAPDVALVDIDLPGIDGYEVARRLRRLPELDGTKLIALTGFGSADAQAQAKVAGFDMHVVKPLAAGELQKILQHSA